MKVNEGEVPQYYIEQSHQPIIDPEEFDKVQAEFVRRKGLGHRYSGSLPRWEIDVHLPEWH